MRQTMNFIIDGTLFAGANMTDRLGDFNLAKGTSIIIFITAVIHLFTTISGIIKRKKKIATMEKDNLIDNVSDVTTDINDKQKLK